MSKDTRASSKLQDTVLFEGYQPPTLVKHGSLSELTLEPTPVSGGGSPWGGEGGPWG